jgi:pyruvate/2-oxoglutarate dehydrogenase complex dihydrolipoamide acyltransferase (E2) component
MAEHSDGYQAFPYPLQRRIIADSVRVGRRKNLMYGLFELDITQARRAIHEHRARTGEGLSFTAFAISCLGRAVGQHKSVQGILNPWGRVVVFDEVDIATSIQIEFRGEPFPLTHIIRGADRRSLREIHDEIRGVQADRQAVEHAEHTLFLSSFLLLPPFVRDMFYGVFLASPKLMKRTIGTVFVSSVGMFGDGNFWGISPPIYNLGLTLGGAADKPVVRGGQVEIRQMMSVTVVLNHDIVDGAPAARFVTTLKQLIERGDGLEGSDQG